MTTASTALAPGACSARLPEMPGFYWWRETPCREWRMVQIVDYTPKADRRHLRAYDVEMGDWRGRSIDIWAEFDPVGEWLPVPKPNSKLSGPDQGGAT
jgi:hypothetical protein